MPQSLSETSLVTNDCPIRMGNSDIVLQDEFGSSDIVLEDEFGNSDLLDVEEYGCINRELVNLENAAVNIDNSNDVIIGPVTQFNVSGNVTIYQNGQNHNEAIEEIAINKEQQSKQSVHDDFKPKDVFLDHCFDVLYKNKNIVRNLGIFMLILLICLIIAFVLIEHFTLKEDEFDYQYKENDYGNHLGEHNIYYRRDWGGKPPKIHTVPLSHPISLIIISHSATLPCDFFEECAALVKQIQTNHISGSTKSVDIGYNFLIGGDGNIYVGRSWDVQNFHRKNSIGISFIGDYNFDEFTVGMIDAVQLLIKQGHELRKLADDYKLVGENQTNSKMYLSPGLNVYKEMRNWPHFHNRTMF